MRSWGWCLCDVIGVLPGRGRETRAPSPVHWERTWQDGGHLQAKRRGLSETSPAGIWILDFPDSRTMKNELQLFKPLCDGGLSKLIHASWILCLSQYTRDQHFNRKTNSFTFTVIIDICTSQLLIFVLIVVTFKRSHPYFPCFLVSLIQEHGQVWGSLP